MDTPIIRIQGYFSTALELLLQTQAHLFLSQSVLSGMNRGMSSSYISVREKNLKLLWTAADTYPRLLTLYLPVLLQGCSDRGISVRKISYRLTHRLMLYLLQRNIQKESRETSLAVRLYRMNLNALTSSEETAVRKLCLESVADAWLFRAPLSSSFLDYLSMIAKNTTARVNEVKAQSGSAITRVEEGLKQIGEVFNKQDKYLFDLSAWILHTLRETLPEVNDKVRECLDILCVLAEIHPKSFIHQLLHIQRSLESLLESPISEKNQRQIRTYLAGKLLDILQNVLRECEISPAVSTLQKCLLQIIQQATSVSLVEKASQCVVVIVSPSVIISHSG